MLFMIPQDKVYFGSISIKLQGVICINQYILEENKWLEIYTN